MPRKKRSNPKTKHQAIQLRKKSTPAERKLWSRIRDDQLGVNFKRHCPRRHQAAIKAVGDTCRRTRGWKLHP